MLQLKKYSLIKQTYIVYVALIGVWIITWLLKINLDILFPELTTSSGSFMFWTLAKIGIWILPALYLIRLSWRKLSEVFNLSNWKSWLAWGTWIGFLIALTAWVPNYLAWNPIFPTKLSFSLVNVLLIAPFFEEFLIRGAIFINLMKKYSLWKANIISSFMFVGLHIPGWYFMGSLAENITKPVGWAFSIFLISLAFGYAVYRSRSVLWGTIAHFLNNLA